MYGKSDTGFPQRIVCLSSEHVEICYALGAESAWWECPGTAHRPAEARDKPRVGGFTSFRADKIRELEPDLVLCLLGPPGRYLRRADPRPGFRSSAPTHAR